MELIPAIDLLGGKVVRLAQGDYDRVTDYGDDPVAVARSWVDQGATRLHLVDLEAARDGTRSQAAHHRAHRLGGAASRARSPAASATRDIAATLLEAGVDRVVLGTALIRDPDLARHPRRPLGSAAHRGRDRCPRRPGRGRWLDGRCRRCARARPHHSSAVGGRGPVRGHGHRPGRAADRPGHGPAGTPHVAGDASRSSRRRRQQPRRHPGLAAGYGGAILGRALYEGRSTWPRHWRHGYRLAHPWRRCDRRCVTGRRWTLSRPRGGPSSVGCVTPEQRTENSDRDVRHREPVRHPFSRSPLHSHRSAEEPPLGCAEPGQTGCPSVGGGERNAGQPRARHRRLSGRRRPAPSCAPR